MPFIPYTPFDSDDIAVNVPEQDASEVDLSLAIAGTDATTVQGALEDLYTILTPPAEGSFTLTATDGVLSWEEVVA